MHIQQAEKEQLKHWADEPLKQKSDGTKSLHLLVEEARRKKSLPPPHKWKPTFPQGFFCEGNGAQPDHESAVSYGS